MKATQRPIIHAGADSPQRLLVVATRRIGDVLLTTPLIRSLRRAWPEAKIDVLVFAHTEGLLLANPDIRRIITIPERFGFWSHLGFLARIFRHYDIALSTLTGDRPTLYAWAAGKKRVGMVENRPGQQWKKRLLSNWVDFDNLNTHTVLMNLQLADLLAIPHSHEIVVSWTPKDEKVVSGVLPFDIRREKFALAHVYPKFPYKMWHKQGWAALGQWLNSKGIRLVLTGSPAPDELAYVGEIMRILPGDTVNLAGRLNLSQAAFLASLARLYIGPDTAMTHMAAALGVPAIALFGPSNPVKWGPWPKGYERDANPYRMQGSQLVGNVFLLQGEGDCVPCLEEGCERHVNSLSDCLQHLPAEKVIQAAEKMLRAL